MHQPGRCSPGCGRRGPPGVTDPEQLALRASAGSGPRNHSFRRSVQASRSPRPSPKGSRARPRLPVPPGRAGESPAGPSQPRPGPGTVRPASAAARGSSDNTSRARPSRPRSSRPGEARAAWWPLGPTPFAPRAPSSSALLRDMAALAPWSAPGTPSSSGLAEGPSSAPRPGPPAPRAALILPRCPVSTCVSSASAIPLTGLRSQETRSSAWPCSSRSRGEHSGCRSRPGASTPEPPGDPLAEGAAWGRGRLRRAVSRRPPQRHPGLAPPQSAQMACGPCPSAGPQ